MSALGLQTSLFINGDYISAGKNISISNIPVINNTSLYPAIVNSSLTSLGTILNFNATNATTSNINIKNGNVSSMFTTTGTVSTLYSGNAIISNIYSTSAGTISSLYTNNASASTLYSNTGTIGTLYTNNASVGTLYATTGTIRTLYTTNASASTLYASIGTIGTLYAANASVSSLYTTNASMSNVYINTSTIGSLIINNVNNQTTIPLYIPTNGNNQNNIPLNKSFNSASSLLETNLTTSSISLKADNSIWTLGAFIASSDQRIKTNISKADTTLALKQILDLPLMTFNYIDTIENGSNKVVGMIAQEVMKVVPEAIIVTTGIVPSIYKIATKIELVDNNVLLTIHYNTKDLYVGCKLKIILHNKKTIITNILNFTEQNILVTKWDNFNINENVFVYGPEVNNYHTIDEPYLGILCMGAIQEIHTITDKSTYNINNLINDKNLILEKINELENTTNNKIMYVKYSGMPYIINYWDNTNKNYIMLSNVNYYSSIANYYYLSWKQNTPFDQINFSNIFWTNTQFTVPYNGLYNISMTLHTSSSIYLFISKGNITKPAISTINSTINNITNHNTLIIASNSNKLDTENYITNINTTVKILTSDYIVFGFYCLDNGLILDNSNNISPNTHLTITLVHII
jgi:hypothetical protein